MNSNSTSYLCRTVTHHTGRYNCETMVCQVCYDAARRRFDENKTATRKDCKTSGDRIVTRRLNQESTFHREQRRSSRRSADKEKLTPDESIGFCAWCNARSEDDQMVDDYCSVAVLDKDLKGDRDVQFLQSYEVANLIKSYYKKDETSVLKMAQGEKKMFPYKCVKCGDYIKKGMEVAREVRARRMMEADVASGG